MVINQMSLIFFHHSLLFCSIHTFSFLISDVRKQVFTDGTCYLWDSCLDQKQANLSLCLAAERALMDGWCV